MVFGTETGRARDWRARGGRPTPTAVDVAYGKHERQRLDFWQAKASKPTPLVVFFHGGGFKAGDKAAIHGTIDVKAYLAQGVSCASVNYPFLKKHSHNYMTILKECEDAIDFILKNARKWNIDKKRIAASGVSAGALITEWLGLTTRHISVMGVSLQPMGTDRMILPRLRRKSPPIIIYQPSPTSDNVHHPKYGIMLKAACDKKGVECVLWGSGSNGIEKLPNGKRPKQATMEFFFKAWGMKPRN
jgi:predicted esterase